MREAWYNCVVAEPLFANVTRRFLLLLLIATGLICGFAAVSFHWLVDFMTSILIGPAVEQQGFLRVVAVIAIPTLVAAGLTLAMGRFAPMASGANLARVRRAYAEDPALLDSRSLAATAIGTPVSLGSGAPLGPEGPIVVLSSGIAMMVGRVAGIPKRMIRGMIPVGTAAGIAAIFNTPITGVVFAMEEVMGSASKGVLGGTIVAAVAAAVVERMMLGGEPILRAPSGTWSDPMELAGFLLVGVVAGLVSGASMRALVRVRGSARKRFRSPVWRAAAGGAVIGLIGLYRPAILGVGYETTSLFLRGGGSFEEAALDFGAKAFAFVIALAAGLVGGIFAPSLFLGAALGAAVGHGALLIFPDANIYPGAYALVGMGAFFAGLLRVPIASVLIVFEVTGDYGLILPLMLAIAVSISLSRIISPQTLTERQMTEEGWREPAAADPLARMVVADAMSKDIVHVTPEMKLLEVARDVTQRHRQYPVVDKDGGLLGLLPGAAIARAVRESLTEDSVAGSVEAAKLVVSPSDVITDVIRKMRDTGVDRCPVVDEKKRVVGFISPSDIIRVRLRPGSEDDTMDRHFDRLIG
ncbi:MAG TPA: chloride channel protein [Thermoanaerobaculia bacterium]|nr:chloride channel protein [Thermoanaerobaculia bacterium]